MREMTFLKGFNKKGVIIALIIGALGCVVFISVRGCGGKEVELLYEKVSRGEVVKTIVVTGKLEVLNTYSLMSKISGVVNRIYVDFNQSVRANQLLATIDSTDIDQQMTKVAADLEKTKLDLVSVKMDLDTKKDLYADNLISKKDLEQAELAYKKTLAQLQQNRVQYGIVLKNKSYARIVSPVTGMIISLQVKQMDFVKENQPLFLIAEDMRKMFLTISVDESDIGKIAKNQKVTFTVSAFPESVFEGKIDQVHFNPIEDEKNTSVVMYEAIVSCDNKDLKLKPGMTATATIIIGRKANVMRIPNEALAVNPMDAAEVPGKKYLWKKVGKMNVDNLPVKRVEVKAGLAGDTHTEIESDQLKVGDRVLIRMGRKLRLKDKM